MHINCCCSSPDCLANGCRQLREAARNSIYQVAPPPKGCICPPGSEATCQRGDCGRKNISVSATGVSVGS